MLLSAAELSEVLKLNRVPIVAVREGSIDVEGEVQVSNSLSVNVSMLDGSFVLFELLNDDPDATQYKESKRYTDLTEVVEAVKYKLNLGKNVRR